MFQIHLPRLAHWRMQSADALMNGVPVLSDLTRAASPCGRVVEVASWREHIGRDLKLQQRFVVPRAIEIVRIRGRAAAHRQAGAAAW